MSDNEPTPISIERDWQGHEFDQKLIELAKIPRAYEKFPTRIDVGAIWYGRMSELLRETMEDPTHVERNRNAVLRLGNIVYDEISAVGTELHVKSVVNLSRNAHLGVDRGQIKVYGQTDQLIVGMHTHGDQLAPPSPADLTNVIMEGSDPMAEVMQVVITPGIRIAMFKTLQTDAMELSQERAIKNTQKWTHQVLDKIKANLTQGMQLSERRNLQYRINMEEILKIAKITHVRLYSSTDNSVFTRFE